MSHYQNEGMNDKANQWSNGMNIYYNIQSKLQSPSTPKTSRHCTGRYKSHLFMRRDDRIDDKSSQPHLEPNESPNRTRESQLHQNLLDHIIFTNCGICWALEMAPACSICLDLHYDSFGTDKSYFPNPVLRYHPLTFESLSTSAEQGCKLCLMRA